jgi:hypothetical protein
MLGPVLGETHWDSGEWNSEVALGPALEKHWAHHWAT